MHVPFIRASALRSVGLFLHLEHFGAMFTGELVSVCSSGGTLQSLQES
jgi:hypothetical protein